MPRLTDVVTRSVALGALLLSLMAPGKACADTPTMDANGVVTETRWGSTVTGYYDQQGFFNDGWKPYVLGYYDEHGDWHYYSWTVPLPGYYDPQGNHYAGPLAATPYDDDRRYEYNYSNYYGGYGSRSELQRGWTRVIGTDGQPHYVDLKDNRVIVHLLPDNNMSRELDVERGFDRNTNFIVGNFDPPQLDITTGEHVSFVAEDGSYILTPTSGSAWKESVPITTNRVYNWTFTEPGTYRFLNAKGGGPSDCHSPGLVIHVSGNAVAWNDSGWRCAKFWEWRGLPWVWSPAATIIQPIPVPHYNAPPPARPVPPKKVHKKILRNKDVK